MLELWIGRFTSPE